MRRLALLGDDKVAVEEVPDPVPTDDQVLVRVVASALCGSERRALRDGAAGNAGHEAVGLVDGELWAVSAVSGCGSCVPCAEGEETRCARGPAVQGGMHADLVAVPRSALRQVPSGLDPVSAVLLLGDTVGVAARTLRRVPAEGTTVVVLGLGPVGLGHVLVRTRTGRQVVGVDPSPYRRELATSLGALALASLDELPDAPGLVVECTGLAECARAALDVVRPGGTVVQSGECPELAFSPSATLVRREVTYTGCWYFTSRDVALLHRLHAEGLDPRPLATHVLPAERAQEGVEAFTASRSGKVVLLWD